MQIVDSLRRVGLVFWFAASTAWAADIQADSHTIFMSGVISAGDENTIARLLPTLKRSAFGTIGFSIRSNGGDINTAMRIGRLLRKAEANVETCSCQSACVLVLVAGVTRGGCAGNARIGVHRIYAATIDSRATTDEIRNHHRKLLTEIRDYLDEMSAPQTLLELMESVPPESMRYLSKQEQERYGLLGDDPAWNEKQTAHEARRSGLSSAEFRRRDALARAQCGYEGIAPAGYAPRATCRGAIMWGISKEDLSNLLPVAMDQCGNLSGEAQRVCFIRVLQRQPK